MSDYVPTDWVDNVTPVDAARMDKIEAGIDGATDAAIALDGRLDVIEPLLVSGTGRLAANAALITDWNSATASGWYRCATSATNKPAASTAFVGMVMADSANYLIQIAWPHLDAQTAAPRRWIRTRNNGVWGAWYQVEPAAGGGAVDYENAWAAGTPYTAGDVVVYNGVEYITVNPGTGQTPPALVPATPAPVSLVTALPSSPFDGQTVDFTDSLTTPSYVWRFRYVAAAPTNKWKFIGGAPMLSEITPEESVAGGTYADPATPGPSLTTPVAGEYQLLFGAFAYSSGNVGERYMAPKFGAATALDADAAYGTDSGATAVGAGMSRQIKRTIAAATLVKMQYRHTGGGASIRIRGRYFSLIPVAVS